MGIQKKLEQLFIDLPEPPLETGNFAGAARSGNLLFVGGVLPYAEGHLQFPGRVGVEVRLDNARLAARMAAVMALAEAKRGLDGSLDRVLRPVRVTGFVASGVDFRDHKKVLDGAGELYAQLFGAKAKPVCVAVGVSSLPNNSCVELEVVFEIK